jgi:hypothetical protein
MTQSTVIFVAAALVIAFGVVLLALISKKAGRDLDVEKYQGRWLVIENSLKREDTGSFQLSILHADKLLDQALRESGYRGQTMGERMKAANSVWKNADHVWGAHKIRNRIAHEADAHVNYDIAKRSLLAFKQALKDLGAI